MYVGSLNDRKKLGFSCIKNSNTIEQLANFESTLKNPVAYIIIIAKDKTKLKRVMVVIFLGGAFYFSNVQSSEATGLSMPPRPVVRVQPSYQYDFKTRIAKVIPRKENRIVYKSPEELLFLMHLNDPRISSNQKVLKLVTELRGGGWGFLETAGLLGVIILIFSVGEGFVNLNPGWGLEGQNPVQPPGPLRYPPVYDVLSPRPGSPRPGSTLGVNRPSSVPHQQFVELTKEERRSLPHNNNMKIIHEGRPKLEVGF